MTHEFPYGNSETSFIGPELKVLYQHFSIPAIFTFPGGEEEAFIDSSTCVYIGNENKKYPISLSVKLRFYVLIFMPWFFGFIFKAFKHKIGLRNIKNQISQMRKYLHLAYFIHEKNKLINAEVLYSYWFDHWNVAACIYKKLYNSSIKIISRAHRYEIDMQSSSLGFFPFQHLQFEETDLVSFISSTWKNKLALAFPKYIHKMKVHRMGVLSHNTIESIYNKDNRYHLISISGNIPVKRMPLQLLALNQIDMDITWHHFGNSFNDNSLNDGITNPRLLYINHGFIQPQDLYNWLGNNFVHFLMNTSRIEGVPVSMMECISKGIPIFAMDVGGIKEIVNEKTGVLVTSNVDAGYLATQLKEALKNYKFDFERRKKIIQFFEENYNATLNYNDFCHSIIQQLK